MNYKEIFLRENLWKEANEAMELYADFFNKTISKNGKILLVGTGWSYEQYFDWPTLLLKLEPSLNISYLEVSDVYIKKWSNNIFPLITGDVREIDNIITHGDFDVVCWFHGPEHVKQEEMLSTFEKIFSIVNVGVIFACPWGNFYDYQDTINENTYETHSNKSMGSHSFGNEFSDYTINYCDGKNSPKGSIIITRLKS